MFSDRFPALIETNRIARLLAQKHEAGAPVVDLTETNPTRVGFDVPGKQILETLSQPGVLTYRPEPLGLELARQAVSGYYARRGSRPDPERLLLTSGSSEGYAFLFKLLGNPGDRFLIPQPSYPLFDYLARAESVELRPYELQVESKGADSVWRINLDSLREAICPKTRGVIVIHPNNPTGCYLQEGEWEAIEDACAASDLALICDEVFFDFPIGDTVGPVSPAGRDRVLTFVLNGLSKTLGMPQLKLGWILTGGPADAAAEAIRRLEILSDTYLSVNTPVQLALPELLLQLDTFQSQVRSRLWANYSRLRRAFDGTAAQCFQSEGGWSSVIRVPRVCSDEEWALDLLEHHDVRVHPGFFFDFPQEAYLVVSLLPEPAVFEEGLRRLQKGLQPTQG